MELKYIPLWEACKVICLLCKLFEDLGGSRNKTIVSLDSCGAMECGNDMMEQLNTSREEGALIFAIYTSRAWSNKTKCASKRIYESQAACVFDKGTWTYSIIACHTGCRPFSHARSSRRHLKHGMTAIRWKEINYEELFVTVRIWNMILTITYRGSRRVYDCFLLEKKIRPEEGWYDTELLKKIC